MKPYAVSHHIWTKTGAELNTIISWHDTLTEALKLQTDLAKATAMDAKRPKEIRMEEFYVEHFSFINT